MSTNGPSLGSTVVEVSGWGSAAREFRDAVNAKAPAPMRADFKNARRESNGDAPALAEPVAPGEQARGERPEVSATELAEPVAVVLFLDERAQSEGVRSMFSVFVGCLSSES